MSGRCWASSASSGWRRPNNCPWRSIGSIGKAQRVLRVLDTRLARSAFLGGGDYGLADIMTWPWIRSAQLRLGLELGELAHLMRWFAEIAARPAVQRGLAIPAAAPVPAPAAVSGPDPQR